MKILFLTQVLPYPLDAGPKIRAYYTLKYLSLNHLVSLVSFVRPSDTKEALFHLNTICHHVETVFMPRSRIRDGLALLKSLASGIPFLIARDSAKAMDLSISKIVRGEQFDAIHADQLWMAPYVLKAKKEAIQSGYRPYIILDQHNAVYKIPQRMADSSGNLLIKKWLLHESNLMRAYEQATCSIFDGVVWVTKEDLNSVSSPEIKKKPKSGIDTLAVANPVIPICYDPSVIRCVDNLPYSNNILFLGGMHWPPNADGVSWFVNEIFPTILNELSDARFAAVGKQPPPGLTNKVSNNVIVPGYVNNTDEYWAKSRVFVVPLRAGGGMRVKILEAWAKGVPVVSTSIGAEGLTYQNEKDILIADSPEDFARTVLRVLKDEILANKLRANGRITLETQYDWHTVYRDWDKVYPIEQRSAI